MVVVAFMEQVGVGRGGVLVRQDTPSAIGEKRMVRGIGGGRGQERGREQMRWGERRKEEVEVRSWSLEVPAKNKNPTLRMWGKTRTPHLGCGEQEPHT